MIFAFFKPHNIFDRENYINKIRKELNIDLISIIDSSAVISPTATIGIETYIGPNVVLDSDAKIGKNNIILFNSIISREVEITDSCFISAGCVLKGSVRINESSFISANASIAKNINAKSFINAGLLLTEEVNQSSIVGCSDSLVTIELPDDINKGNQEIKVLTSMKINHIGYVVKSLEKSTQYYCENFGYSVKVKRIFVKNQLVDIMLKSPIITDPDLELICPTTEDSPAYNSLRRGEVINHICYQTKNYAEVLKNLKSVS